MIYSGKETAIFITREKQFWQFTDISKFNIGWFISFYYRVTQ